MTFATQGTIRRLASSQNSCGFFGVVPSWVAGVRDRRGGRGGGQALVVEEADDYA